jgi:predicted DNA-binding antitoxin AbrB/MazE fold protein
MSQTIRAIYENDIFRPLQPLDLPEGSIVWIEIIRILEDDTGFIENIEKDLSELDKNKVEHLKKEIDD